MSDFNNLIEFLNPYRDKGAGLARQEYQYIRIDQDFVDEDQNISSNNLTKIIKYKKQEPFANPFSEVNTSLPLYIQIINDRVVYYFQKNRNGENQYIEVEDLINLGEDVNESYKSLDDTTFIRIEDQEFLFYNFEQNSLYTFKIVLREIQFSVRKTLDYNIKELGGLSSGIHYVDYTNAKGYTNGFFDRVLGTLAQEISDADLYRRLVDLDLNPKPGKLYRFPDFEMKEGKVHVYYDYDFIENDDFEVDPVTEDYAIKLTFVDPEGFLGYMMEVYFLNGVSVLNTNEGTGNRKANFSRNFLDFIGDLLDQNYDDITKKLSYLYYVPEEVFEKKFSTRNTGEEYIWKLIEEAANISLTNIRGANKGDIVLKLLEAIKLNQGDEYLQDEKKNNQFLEELLKRRTKDFETLLYRLTKGLDGASFEKFIYFIWSIWKNSSYAVINPEENKKVKITEQSPVLLDFRTNEVLGFYIDNAKITWVDEKNQIDITVNANVGTIEVQETVNIGDDKPFFITTGGTKLIDDFKPLDYQYHPFSPIIIENSENPKFLLKDEETSNTLKTTLPAFLLFANKERAFWKNVFTSLEYGVDILTTISGIGNIIKAGRLVRILKGGKAVLLKTAAPKVITAVKAYSGVVEITSGTVNALLKLTQLDDTALGREVSKYLFYLEMAALVGEISVVLREKLKSTANKILDNPNFEKSLDDLVKKGEIDEVGKNKLISEVENASGLNAKIEDFFKRVKKKGTSLRLINISEIVKQLRNITPQSTEVARALNKGRIEKNVYEDSIFEAYYKMKGGKPEIYASAFEIDSQMFFRESTPVDKYFNEIVHEGTHALDRAKGIINNYEKLYEVTKDLVFEGQKVEKIIKGLNLDELVEFRARLFEMEFQIATKQERDFKSLKEMTDYIREFYND